MSIQITDGRVTEIQTHLIGGERREPTGGEYYHLEALHRVLVCGFGGRGPVGDDALAEVDAVAELPLETLDVLELLLVELAHVLDRVVDGLALLGVDPVIAVSVTPIMM